MTENENPKAPSPMSPAIVWKDVNQPGAAAPSPMAAGRAFNPKGQADNINWRAIVRLARILLGPALIIALFVIAFQVHGAVDDSYDVSAVQVTQLYTEAAFHALVVIGMALGGTALFRSLD
jgi:hypothetical protein